MNNLIKFLLYPIVTPIRDKLKRHQYKKEGYSEHPCIVKDAWGQTGMTAFIEQSNGSYRRFKIVIDRGENSQSCVYLKEEEIMEAFEW